MPADPGSATIPLAATLGSHPDRRAALTLIVALQMRKLLQTHYGGATVHGMRAAFRTWAAEVADARDDVAETALAHLVGSETVRAYNRTERFHDREELMNEWGLWVEGRWDLFANDNTAADRREAVLRRRLGDETYEEIFAGGAQIGNQNANSS